MATTWRLLTPFVGVLCAGCATATPMSLESLLERGQSDVIAATHELKGRRLLLDGVVSGKDFVRKKVLQADANPWSQKLTATEVGLQVPVVILGLPGRVNCFFDPSDTGELAPIQVGDRVTLECTFVEYQGTASSRIPVLAGCQVGG